MHVQQYRIEGTRLSQPQGFGQGLDSRNVIVAVSGLEKRYADEPLIARIVFDDKDIYRPCTLASTRRRPFTAGLHDSLPCLSLV
jgi:hypothetical protein